MRCLLALAFLLCPAPQASAQQMAAELWKEGIAAFQAGDLDRARRLIEQTLDLAILEKNREVEGDARYGLALGLRRAAQYEKSDVQLRASLAIFEELGVRSKQVAAYRSLGANANDSGRPAEARASFEKALTLSESLEDWREVAAIHHDLTFVTKGDESFRHLQEGLQLARETGARKIEAVLLHQWADSEYSSGDFDAAFDRLNQARAILEELGDRAGLAGVLTSLGRLYRFHGHPDEAFRYYQRARDLHQQVVDIRGVVQSLNAMGVALNIMGRSTEALGYDQEALGLARESGSSVLIKAILEAIASTEMRLGFPDKAAEVLEEARRMTPPRYSTLSLLSEARFKLRQYEAAREAAEEAIGLAGSGEAARDALSSRAQAMWKLGRISEALSDVRQLMDSVEKARARLIPTDFMRQGFADTDRRMTSLSIQVMLDSAQDREALEAAERARGRAFLDLLATKNVIPRSANPEEKTPDGARAPPVSLEDLVSVARRLNSTIVTYWVDDSSTVIWTVSPDGRVSCARTGFSSATLEKWIDDALGFAPRPQTRAAAPVPTRSRDTVLAAQTNRAALRRLYDALIRPIRSNLPAKPGTRVTIIPNGPLFRLSFAALLDEKGRYLIENYALHYAPAIDVFRYTRRAALRAAETPTRYMLVANPTGMPKADGTSLPPLPGTEKEVQAISRFTPPGATAVLQRGNASETAVRDGITSAKFIHLATHGVIDSSNPLNSFIALGKTGDQPTTNGRLTAEEVYVFDLRADLVVLSACRTGLGRISGDGVAGLARAFLYAGAASVISTLWDVADEPAARLLESFYRGFLNGTPHTKIDSLRAAQLRLLHSLRRGEVRVDTPFGALALPEDPRLWGGYALVGEP